MKLGSDSKQAIESLALDKGVAVESMYEALVSAFRSAYMRIPGAAEEARVTLNPDSGEVLIYAQELDNEGNVIEEWKVELDEDEFGRIAAQSFKQMMTTKIRDAKRATVLDAYIGREGELITGIVTQFDPRFNQTILDLQDAEAVIPSGERVPFERLERGNRVKALITEVREDAKGIPIIVSRSKAEFVQRIEIYRYMNSGWYERGDSNPYDLYDLRILSPLRLPIPPRSRRRPVYHRQRQLAYRRRRLPPAGRWGF